MNILNVCKQKIIGEYVVSCRLEKYHSKLLERADEIKDSFTRILVLQVVNCGREDVQELYDMLAAKGQESKLIGLDYEGLWRAYCFIAHYQVMMFARREQMETDKLNQALVFEQCGELVPELGEVENIEDFECRAATLFAQNFLNIPQEHAALAFAANFLYNSYSDFIGSFTYYVPLTSRTMQCGGLHT